MKENKLTLTGEVTDVEYGGVSTRVNVMINDEIDICCYHEGEDISEYIHVGDTITINGRIRPERGSVLNWVLFDEFKIIND